MTLPPMPALDPFAMAPDRDPGLERDGKGRPLLIPRGSTRRLPYSRASAMSNYLTSKEGLHRWEKRLVAQGAGLRPDLARMAAAENYGQEVGVRKNDVKRREAGQNIDGYAEQMMEAAGQHLKANYGTAIHSLAESESTGGIGLGDVQLESDMAGFRYAMASIERVADEVFVANDELLVAGTFDGVVRIPGIDGLLVADWKSGEMKPMEHAIQKACYANGEIYDVDTDERTTFEEMYGEPVRKDIGLLVRVVAGSVDPLEKRTKLWLVDLEEGYRAAKVAAYVRQLQSKANFTLIEQLDPRKLRRAVAEREMKLLVEPTPADMRALRDTFADVWDDELTNLGLKRLQAAR